MTAGTVNYTTDRPDRTSFNATILVLRPRETIIVIYTVNLENIHLSGTGNIDFLNTAELFSENNSSRGEAPNHHFGSPTFTHTFVEGKILTKLSGNELNFGMVYGDWSNYNGNNIGMVYDQLDVTELSQLDRKSLVIAIENGMALNWYGGNGSDTKFSGYEIENRVNDKQTVFEVRYDFKWCTKGSGDNDIGIC